MGNLGENLKIYRKSREITQERMADMIHVSLRAYQSYERGEREPALDTLMEIGRVLDVSLEKLLEAPNNDDDALYAATANLIKILNFSGTTGAARDAMFITITNKYWELKKSPRQRKIRAALDRLQEFTMDTGHIITELPGEPDDEED